MNRNSSDSALPVTAWKPALAVLLLVVLCGCAFPEAGYGGSVAIDYGDDFGDGFGYPGDFYEPYGYDYGGWGGGYQVGPPRYGDRRLERPGRPFHAAPPSHRMPSIPSRPRGRR
ncbi:MAG: hypothetical protein P4L11_04345 [Geothrix sp.]|nr:hypothetical protein [Geothrix sp.]